MGMYHPTNLSFFFVFLVRSRFWRWSDDREEYEIVFQNEELEPKWQVNRQYTHIWRLES